METKYVCAFRGRRDSYQVPRALDEVDKLDQFITDVYAGRVIQRLAHGLPSPWAEKVLYRSEPSLSSKRVQCLWGTTLREWGRHAIGIPAAKTYAELDPIYSHMACRRARETRSNLFLYTPYAWEAFTAPYRHSPKRILFQYHPHADYEKRLLKQDARHWGIDFDSGSRAETGTDLTAKQQRRTQDVWQHADKILCASTFTKRTLLEAGADDEDCTVIPYGVKLPKCTHEELHAVSAFRVLFVGSGIQRKGIHHLLHAWNQAQLPPGSHLTLVCRSLDSGINPMIERSANTTLLRGVPFEKLLQLYRTHALFVMPSLIEGFGQVYIEALSQGCPVLGTSNTCLPDIGEEDDGIFTVEVGNIDQLTRRLEDLALLLPRNDEIKEKAMAKAKTFSWRRFRRGVQVVI